MASRTAAVRGFARFLIASKEQTSVAKAVRRSAHDTILRLTCGGGEVTQCAPCRGPAQPTCRSRAHAALRGQRVACRPPQHAARPPCFAPMPSYPLTCEQQTHSTLKGFAKEVQRITGPGGRCGDTMDQVAQRISAARLSRRQEYEQEVGERAARPPATPAPSAYRLAASREVVRAIDGRDYVVLPSLGSPALASHRKCEYNERTPSIELDPAKGCVINHSSHVDPCAHRPRLLLEIDRSEVSNTAQISSPRQNTPSASSLGATQKQKNKVKQEVPKKCCKGSAFSPLTDWCSSLPKIEPERPRCHQPSLVERFKRRSNSFSKEVRKFHTAPLFLLQSLKSTEHNRSSENEIQAIIAKVEADAQKLNTMLNDRAKLKEAGSGRNSSLEETEEASASGQLELRAPAGGANVRVRVRVSLLGTAAPVRPSDSLSHSAYAGASHDASSTHYGKCDSWLSIKNIQKKLTGGRKDSTPIKHLSNDKNASQNPPTKEIERCPGASPSAPKATPRISPCERKQSSPDTQCQTKQKPKIPPCGGTCPPSRCCAATIQFLSIATVLV